MSVLVPRAAPRLSLGAVGRAFAAIDAALVLLFAARDVVAAIEAHRAPDAAALAVLGMEHVRLPRPL